MRVVLTVGGLQGFVFYAAEQLARRPGRVLVEAPSYDRPEGPGPRGRRDRRPADGRRGPRSRRARGRARPLDAPSFLYTIPTFQNSEGGRFRRSGALGSSRSSASTGSRCSRTTRTGSCASRERRLRACSSSREEPSSRTRRRLEDRGTRRADGLLPVAGGRRRGDSRRRAVSTYISPPFLPEAIVWECACAAASSPTSSTCEPSSRHGVTRCSRRSNGTSVTAQAGADPRATSSGSISTDGHDRARDTSRGGGRRDRAGAGFFPRGSGPRRDLRPPRVQLRDAGADRRGDRAAMSLR